MAAQPGVTEELETLVCDRKTLRGSIAENETGAARFIAQVSLYSLSMGVAIAQTTYATGAGGEIQALRQLLEAVELEGVLVQSDALHAKRFSLYLAQRNADFLIAVKNGRRKWYQLIPDRFTYGRRAPWQTSHREVKRGRDITWSLRTMPAPEWVVKRWPGSATIISVRSHGIREDQPQVETRYYVSSLRSGAKALLRTIRQRWSIENSWHWVRGVPLREAAHRYREFNVVQILATLRSLAINALRLDGFWSINEGITALAHDIEGLLRLMGWKEPAGTPSR